MDYLESEGNDIMAFLDQLIKEIWVPWELNIIRAHRTYQERKNFVRPIIVAFLNNILQGAWAKKEVIVRRAYLLWSRLHLQGETWKMPIHSVGKVHSLRELVQSSVHKF